MVLAAALHQSRQLAIDLEHDHEVDGVYLFATDYPDYNRRMEAIAFVARVNMAWDMPHLTLAQ